VRWNSRILAATAIMVTVLPLSTVGTAAAGGGFIRVDQIGYATDEAKAAYLLSPRPATGTRYTIVDDDGRTVESGRLSSSNGAWSETFQAVHEIRFDDLRQGGRYRIRVGGVESPAFRIGSRTSLFSDLVADTVNFFQLQRDGADVLKGRKPSHLADRQATVYHQPLFGGDFGDVPLERLRPWQGLAKVDVEGGWFDAGDFVKFSHASAYALSLMLYAQRELGRKAPQELKRESAFGLSWLDKVWDERSRTLYVQIGLGTGSEEFNFLGDHDVWRLPEADDALETGPGDAYEFIKYRPVFPAAAPGEKLSPNLAGRGSAAFGLAAQLAADAGDLAAARRRLAEGFALYNQAKTTDVGELVTAFPHSYYPEDSWHDDMEFGATELAIAAFRLNDPKAHSLVREAARWAAEYLSGDSQDTLNLYDTSALAHADLSGLLPPGAQRKALVDDLRRQLDWGRESAGQHPFRHAVDVSEFDAASRSFGFAATARLYQRVSGDVSYAAFGTAQRNFTMGANAWGTSLMVGAGRTSPRCPHHQVGNLTGQARGAVVNGPNGAGNFESIGVPDGGRTCPADGVNRFAAFDTAEARYLDDVRSWPSSEPAIDFTATAMLAFALNSVA
jgi:endoglucanase